MEYVYGEDVLILNFFLNYILLYGTGKIKKEDLSMLKLIFPSFLGSMYVIVSIYYLPVVNIFIKAFIGILMCALAYEFKSLNKLLKEFIIFFFLSMFLAGVVLFIPSILGGDFTLVNGKFIASSSSVNIFLGVIFMFLILYEVFKNQENNMMLKQLIFPVSIVGNGINSQFNTYLDTGNFLSTTLGKSIILVKNQVLNKEMKEYNFNIKSYTDYINLYDSLPVYLKDKLSYTYYKSSKEKKMLPVIKVEEFHIVVNGKNHILKNQFIGIDNRIIDSDEYEGLIPLKIIRRLT